MAEIPRKRFITKMLRCHKSFDPCRGESSRRRAERPNWSFFPLEIPIKVLVGTDFNELDPILSEENICDEEGSSYRSEFINVYAS